MMRAPATGLVRDDPFPRRPPPARFTKVVGTYWAPGMPRLPVSSHRSFSR